MVTTKINTSQAAKGALAHRLQCRTACKIQNGRQGAPSMRKGRDGRKKNGEKKKKRQMKIMATTSLPAVDRPNADRWNAARSRQKYQKYDTCFRTVLREG